VKNGEARRKAGKFEYVAVRKPIADIINTTLLIIFKCNFAVESAETD